MTDYGQDLLFGTFVSPVAQPTTQAVDLAVLADDLGLDLVTFQDHPYIGRFYDTWTLLSYAAARTERVRLSGNVLSLPLRQPAVLARSAASLDLLSGGRVELGIGAGAFWDGIEGMGGRRLKPGQAVDAIGEGIRIIREIWDADERGGVRIDGEYHRAHGAKRGPAPAHDIEIWVGAYRPRMLKLVGELGDGFVPSLGYLPGGPADLTGMNRIVDDAAIAAGRNPERIRRMLNIGGRIAPTRGGFLDGPPEQWADELAGLTAEYGTSAFILTADDPATTEVFATEIAPATRERVAARRSET